jgi:hypothetical protein
LSGMFQVQALVETVPEGEHICASGCGFCIGGALVLL